MQFATCARVEFVLECYVAEIVFSAHSTHDFHPRSACLSRLLKYLGGHLKSLKLFKIQHNVALKRLASAVQLRPWPPQSKAVNGIASCPPSPLSVRYFSTRSGSVPGYDDGEGLKLELPLAQSAFSPLGSVAWLRTLLALLPLRSLRSWPDRRHKSCCDDNVRSMSFDIAHGRLAKETA